MGNDILVPLQQEESDPRHPRKERLVVVEKDLDKFYRKLNQCIEQWWYPMGWDFSIVLERWNADLDDDE